MLATLRAMNISEKLITLITLLYEDSSATIVMNNKKGPRFRTRGGVQQGWPLSPYLFIIVLELMAIEVREKPHIKGVQPPLNTKPTTSYSNHNYQRNNKDDRLSMFADNSSTITMTMDQVRAAQEDIHTYQKTSCSELHEGKTLIIKLGKARTKHVTSRTLNVNFTIMEDGKNETYLGDTIGNNVTEEQTFGKALKGIKMLGTKWHKQNIGIHGRTIVANTLLTAKITHRASVNGISPAMKHKLTTQIRNFIWGATLKKHAYHGRY